MDEKPKIKILDNPELRKKLARLVLSAKQQDLANWAINCTKHILDLSEEEINWPVVNFGFETNIAWQSNKATVSEVRQAGFKIHEEARKCKSDITKNILRAAGQAVAVGHMKEHAIVCSDYAIKVIQLYAGNDINEITKERIWQIEELEKIINKTGAQRHIE